MSDWKNVQYKDGKMRTSEGGGGGGSSTFAGLDDVSFDNLQDGQIPKYNSGTHKWENADESGGGGTVTDVQVDGVSVVNQQGVAEIPAIPDGLHHYSTTEQIVGTWTDGKPLYEKTYLGDLNASANSIVFDTLSNVDVVLAFGSVKNKSNMSTMQIGSYINSTYYTGFYMGVGGSLHLYYGNDLRGYKYRLVLQYTKTTD